MITDSEDRSMIAELEQIIQTEEAKPEAERDVDLIDDCIREIAELKGVRADYSNEEIDRITDKFVNAAEKKKKRKRFIRLAAGIAAAFVIVSGVTACAISPVVINWLVQIVKMPFGTAVESGKITYTNQGITKEYKDITDFIADEKLDIYYPSILPDNARLVSIDRFCNMGHDHYTLTYSMPCLCYTIEMENSDFKYNGKMVTEIECGELHFNVYKEESYFAVCETNDMRYILQSDNIQDIIQIVGGLRKE